jgi:hypothetical protein
MLKRYISIILIFSLVFFPYRDAKAYIISNPLLKPLVTLNPISPGSVIGIGLGLSTGFAYMYFKNTNKIYNEKDITNLTSENLDSVPDEVVYNDKVYNYDSISYSSGTCYSVGYITYENLKVYCNAVGSFYYRKLDSRINIIEVRQPPYPNRYSFKIYTYLPTSEQPTVDSLTSDTPFVKVQDTPDENTILLPFVLDTTKSISENVDFIKQQLLNAEYSDDVVNSVSSDSVADIVAHLPASIRQDMPLSTYENALVDRIADEKVDTYYPSSTLTIPLNDSQDAVQVEIKDVPDVPAIPDTIFPAVPEFDTTLDLPAQKDFLLPIKNFFQNVFNSIPFISMINNANIEISNPQSVVNFSYKNQNFSFDFNDYIDTFNFMSTVIIFCASVLFVFILIL